MQNPGRLQDLLPLCGREMVELRWVLCPVKSTVVFLGLQRAAGHHQRGLSLPVEVGDPAQDKD